MAESCCSRDSASSQICTLCDIRRTSWKDAGVRRRLVGLRSVYPKHEEFVAKVAELDAAGLAKALKRLSFMAQSKVYLFWRKDEAS